MKSLQPSNSLATQHRGTVAEEGANPLEMGAMGSSAEAGSTQKE